MTRFEIIPKYGKPPTCQGCPLAQTSTGFIVFRDAPVGSPLIIVEEPSDHDIRVGSPLQPEGDTGSIVERALRLAGLDITQFALASFIACRPPEHLYNQTYEFSAPDFCNDKYLRAFVNRIRPRCIVALGQIVARALTGFSGEKQTIDMIRGYILPGIGVAEGYPVIPAPSPAYILSGMQHETSLLILDLKKASTCKGLPEDPEAEYYALKCFGTREQALRQNGNPTYTLEFALSLLEGDSRRILVYDFEFVSVDVNAKGKRKFSTRANLTQVNFTVISPDSDYSMVTFVADWNNETSPTAIKILQTNNIKVGYNNWHADDEVAIYNSFEVKGREVHDAMWLSNFLFPDLPARRVDDEEEFLTGDDGALMPLQVAASLFGFPAPWKHLVGKEPHFYGARDTHATAVVFIEGCKRLIARNLFGTYDYFVRRYYQEVLKPAELRGYPMNTENLGHMQDFITDEIKQFTTDMQQQVPIDMRMWRERKPRSPEEAVKLQEEHGVNWVVKDARLEDKCKCAEVTVGAPAPGCSECRGTGEIAGKTVKCSKCQSRHSLLKPDSNEPRWTCERCGWKDSLTPTELAAHFEKTGKPKNIKSFMKMIHDDDLRSGRYVCPQCKGEASVTVAAHCPCTKRMTYKPDCPDCKGKGVMITQGHRYYIAQPFNPNSYEQLKQYAQARNYKIPRAGFGREGVSQLARQTGDPVFRFTHDIKTLESIAGAMAPLTSAAAILDRHGVERIKTHFMFTDAAGMVSSKDPDIMTAPPAHKYPGLAEQWRKCLAVRPTETTRLVRLYFGPLELQMFALEAQDEALLTIASGDAEDWLLTFAKFKKTVQGTGAIAAVFAAFIRAIPAVTVYQRNRHLFTGPDMPAYLLGMLETTFPRSVAYRDQQAAIAQRQGYLRSKFGFERQFYAVYRRSRFNAGKSESGADYSNAVSFVARNHTACVLSIVASGPSVRDCLVSPTMSPFGPDGLLVEVGREVIVEVPEVNTVVLVLPDGKPWVPIITVKEFEV